MSKTNWPTLLFKILITSTAGFVFFWFLNMAQAANPGTIAASSDCSENLSCAELLQDGSKINFGCANCVVSVSDSAITGFAWGENIGWINLDPTGQGVLNDGNGALSGFAWGQNAGWINFNPSNGGVSINTSTGEFDGYAWSQNYGWIKFLCPGSACVITDWRPTEVAQETSSGGRVPDACPDIDGFQPYGPCVVAPSPVGGEPGQEPTECPLPGQVKVAGECGFPPGPIGPTEGVTGTPEVPEGIQPEMPVSPEVFPETPREVEIETAPQGVRVGFTETAGLVAATLAVVSTLSFLAAGFIRRRKRGRIVDQSGKGISGAQVVAYAAATPEIVIAGDVSDEAGKYMINLPNGDYIARVKLKTQDGALKTVFVSEPIQIKYGIMNKKFIINI